jgi:transposase
LAGSENEVASRAIICVGPGESPNPARAAVSGTEDASHSGRGLRRPLSHTDRATLERWSRSRSASFKLVLRSRIVLCVARGMSSVAAAQALATTPRTVRLWRRRFEAGGIDVLRYDAPGRGRRAGLSAEAVQRIAARSVQLADGRRPSTRAVASVVGVSPASVCRVRTALGIGSGARQLPTGGMVATAKEGTSDGAPVRQVAEQGAACRRQSTVRHREPAHGGPHCGVARI